MSFRRYQAFIDAARVVMLAVLGATLALSGCRAPMGPTISLDAVSQAQDVGVTVNLPKKELATGRYGVMSTGMTANTLQVTELNVQEGAQVTEGTLLVRIEKKEGE